MNKITKTDYPKRKQLRLQNYDYSSEGTYFITISTKNKQILFGNVIEGIPSTMNLSKIGKIVEKYIKNIDGLLIYAIMPNHLHLLISIEHKTKTTISQIIKSLKILVTKELGYSVWHRSFHDRIVRNEKEFQMIWHYIEHNAEKWKSDIFYLE